MTCERHLLNLRWEQHDWARRVTGTENHTVTQNDMWGRSVEDEHVTCHSTYECRVCGANRAGGDCICDKARGDRCRDRLAFLDAQAH